MTPETQPQGAAKPRPTVTILLLAIYAALTVWLFYLESISWPHEGSWAFFGYIFLGPGIVFQSFNLAYTVRTGRRLARRALTRVVTIPLGLLLAGQLSSGADAISMDGFERSYAPFVAQLGASLAEPCGGAAKYFTIPAVAAYNEQTSGRPTANLSYDSKRFVLAFAGGSIDIDGSTVYYDSAAKQWRRFHNDNQSGRDALDTLTAGLATCRLRAVPAPT